ncbi:Respiratory supercomplex factor 1, mitochondrial [Ceratocystis fimbriata CBS 114723]|uniref:Respiratory supercomplex factor 1 mitochondrial n=3 Tax=Ceratocystis TaxID=5157 RepID=A0A0F8B0X2_CERFI|nr:Respiratory supercomplex factor 1 mitochondrial [Ceratocystis platani]PHH53066.1 Respiratory supercomplex factor 1, mitochondrial [Ceratocystis fimbriata CBS 114723]
MSSNQLPSSFEHDELYNERPMQKVWRKLREEPLIPLGCFATVFAFTGAYRALRRGDSKGANRMFRYRVGAQGFTVLAMIAGSIYYSRDRERTAELRRLEEQQNAEEKRARWLRELEARDAEDKEMRAALEARRRKRQERLLADESGSSTGGEKSVFQALSKAKTDREAREKESKATVAAADEDSEDATPFKQLGFLVAQQRKAKEEEKKKSQESK